MKRYIYEMVTFEPWENENPEHFYIAYHFEDFFTSRKAAIKYTNGYIEWLLSKKIAIEAIEVNQSNKTNSQLVLWKVVNHSTTEYYGIVRNVILN